MEEFPLEIVCDPPVCPIGCKAQARYNGPCLRCSCKKDETNDDRFRKVICDSPRCPPDCFLDFVYGGPCLGCDCKKGVSEDPSRKVICEALECPLGCQIQQVYEGPCPGCDCKEDGCADIRGKNLQCPHRDSNSVSPEYVSDMLPVSRICF
ncbi:tenascin-R-like [Stegodyphus dumicola]|uniref:tenascin-R-like n=1 Tax=Stegodyphus dumicola TaxID=202533 RepID=UPI0015B130B2|nr:tenascin-R-like [Stegodyphus dumicola]